MKLSTIIFGLLGGVFVFAVSQAHADQMGELCTILNNSQKSLAVLNRQIANERNPLKQSSLQQKVSSVNQQREASLKNFLDNHHQFTNFTGVVSNFEVMHYNTGPGVMLGITIPCGINVAFQFIEISNPAWGNLDPERQTPLSKWRPALENIVKGDSVMFSGRFVANKGMSFAVMTELRKKGGIAYKVPDPYQPLPDSPQKNSFLPILNGAWVYGDTPCEQASNATLQWYDGMYFYAGRSFSHADAKFCSMHIDNTSNNTYQLTRRCQMPIDNPNEIGEELTLKYTVQSPTKIMISSDSGSAEYRFCDQSKLPPTWRGPNPY